MKKSGKDWFAPPLKTSGDCLAAAERELGVSLPREYRMRLMANNGGELLTSGREWRVFPVRDETDAAARKRSARHIVLETGIARAQANFPVGAVAIATNDEGDYLVFLPARARGSLEPQVQVWSHETGKCKPSALKYD